MDMQSYTELVGFTQSTVLILFISLFALVLVYALWPRNKQAFDHAAHIPLQDDIMQSHSDETGQIVTGKD